MVQSFFPSFIYGRRDKSLLDDMMLSCVLISRVVIADSRLLNQFRLHSCSCVWLFRNSLGAGVTNRTSPVGGITREGTPTDPPGPAFVCAISSGVAMRLPTKFGAGVTAGALSIMLTG
jgi:hypothetical protein